MTYARWTSDQTSMMSDVLLHRYPAVQASLTKFHLMMRRRMAGESHEAQLCSRNPNVKGSVDHPLPDRRRGWKLPARDKVYPATHT